MAEMQDYSERRMRAAIAQAPKGTYYGEDAVDDDGLADDPLVGEGQGHRSPRTRSQMDFEGTCAAGGTQPQLPLLLDRCRPRSRA